MHVRECKLHSARTHKYKYIIDCVLIIIIVRLSQQNEAFIVFRITIGMTYCVVPGSGRGTTKKFSGTLRPIDYRTLPSYISSYAPAKALVSASRKCFLAWNNNNIVK